MIPWSPSWQGLTDFLVLLPAMAVKVGERGTVGEKRRTAELHNVNFWEFGRQNASKSHRSSEASWGKSVLLGLTQRQLLKILQGVCTPFSLLSFHIFPFGTKRGSVSERSKRTLEIALVVAQICCCCGLFYTPWPLWSDCWCQRRSLSRVQSWGTRIVSISRILFQFFSYLEECQVVRNTSVKIAQAECDWIVSEGLCQQQAFSFIYDSLPIFNRITKCKKNSKKHVFVVFGAAVNLVPGSLLMIPSVRRWVHFQLLKASGAFKAASSIAGFLGNRSKEPWESLFLFSKTFGLARRIRCPIGVMGVRNIDCFHIHTVFGDRILWKVFFFWTHPNGGPTNCAEILFGDVGTFQHVHGRVSNLSTRWKRYNKTSASRPLVCAVPSLFFCSAKTPPAIHAWTCRDNLRCMVLARHLLAQPQPLSTAIHLLEKIMFVQWTTKQAPPPSPWPRRQTVHKRAICRAVDVSSKLLSYASKVPWTTSKHDFFTTFGYLLRCFLFYDVLRFSVRFSVRRRSWKRLGMLAAILQWTRSWRQTWQAGVINGIAWWGKHLDRMHKDPCLKAIWQYVLAFVRV